jgi:hypothetical protein
MMAARAGRELGNAGKGIQMHTALRLFVRAVAIAALTTIAAPTQAAIITWQLSGEIDEASETALLAAGSAVRFVIPIDYNTPNRCGGSSAGAGWYSMPGGTLEIGSESSPWQTTAVELGAERDCEPLGPTAARVIRITNVRANANQVGASILTLTPAAAGFDPGALPSPPHVDQFTLLVNGQAVATGHINSVTVVPAPTALTSLALGLGAWGVRRRQHRWSGLPRQPFLSCVWPWRRRFDLCSHPRDQSNETR